MRTFVVLICSLALACLTLGAQEEKGKKKEQKKGAQAGQVSSHPGKPAGKPVQAAKPVPVKQPSDFGKVKNTGNTVGSGEFGGTPGTPAHGKKAEVRQAKGTSKPTTTVKPAGALSPIAGVKSGKAGVAAGKPFKPQHFNLQTNKVVTKYKTVNFNQNYKIAGAYKWKGPKYAVFVNYHPLWQSQWWWRSHYNHIVFIYGGWYYWNAGYWCPAWGYAPDSVYYFDGPIYASSPDEDPAQVVANVQSALQQQGYYRGEIDGILGPQTRAALAEYQSAQGLEPTGAVDEPTLETLGMA